MRWEKHEYYSTWNGWYITRDKGREEFGEAFIHLVFCVPNKPSMPGRWTDKTLKEAIELIKYIESISRETFEAGAVHKPLDDRQRHLLEAA